jgi:hypothetical protein
MCNLYHVCLDRKSLFFTDNFLGKLFQSKMSELPRQPRQPKDLPGLMKFCLEATG